MEDTHGESVSARTGIFDQGWVHVDGWRELVRVAAASEQWVNLSVLLA